MKHILGILIILCALSCTVPMTVKRTIDAYPDIFPDYTDITIPPNIAPLNFKILTPHIDARVEFSGRKGTYEFSTNNGKLYIPKSKWKSLLSENLGCEVKVTIYTKDDKEEWTVYKPFIMNVAEEKIDRWLAYRLIEPGYESWFKMGIYQRNLETFKESAIFENKMTNYNCVNCHSFCMQNPKKMLFHLRAIYPGTIIINGGLLEKLNTKTDSTISPFVYPSWHPSCKFIAFSTNTTKQIFHSNDKNRIEVYDEASDVIVYDVLKHEVFTSALIFSKKAFETFPTFSSDGRILYFCSASALPMPESYKQLKYSLCSITFDPETRTFGKLVDTLYNARIGNCSASFPRVSPDGKYLLYSLSSYGNFSIWHKNADLCLTDLTNKENINLDVVNSNDVESYHSWSNNSHWFVFSSRRIDGLYTCPFIAYLDKMGKPHKPFLLPQKDVEFYKRLMKSYNIPEFLTGKVEYSSRKIAIRAMSDDFESVKWKKDK